MSELRTQAGVQQEPAQKKHVRVWTDGACIGNPGAGGYAAVLLFGEHRREISGGYRRTTNNRMELMAVIAALEALKYPCQVTVHSDARYVVDGVTDGGMRRWHAARWRRGEHGRVPNADLWERLLVQCQRHEVTLTWVPAHQGVAENERCDELSVLAATAEDLAVDLGYEQRDDTVPAEPTLFDGL